MSVENADLKVLSASTKLLCDTVKRVWVHFMKLFNESLSNKLLSLAKVSDRFRSFKISRYSADAKCDK